jgi:hypothetical protein
MSYKVEMPATGRILRVVAHTKAELLEAIKSLGQHTQLQFEKVTRTPDKTAWACVAEIPTAKENVI